MSSTTTHKREQIRLYAQRQREVELSRHEISKLAHELLQKRLDERHASIEQTNLEELARVGDESTIHATKLAVAVEHEKEKTEFEDARFAMIVEFDAQRDKLLGASLAKKLEEEGLEHTALLESLHTKLAREDQEAGQALQKAVEESERKQKKLCYNCGEWNLRVHGMACKSCGRQLVFEDSPEVLNARSQAQRSTLKRHDIHQQLVDHHNSKWELRQEVLRLELDNRASRQARLDLEYDFQHRFTEHDQRQKAIQQRHAKELETLENERSSALAAAQQMYERAKEDLLEERLRVEGWWNHLCDDSEASLRRIDEDERRVLDEIHLQDIAAAAEVEGETLSVEAEVTLGTVAEPSQDVKAQVSLGAAAADEEETFATTRSTADEVASVLSSSDTARSSVGTACGDDDSAGKSINDYCHGASFGPSNSLADLNRVEAVVASDRSPHTLAQSMAFEPYRNLASAHVTPHNNGLQINLTTPCFNVEPADCVLDRSGSPDSGGSDSDFVEI